MRKRLILLVALSGILGCARSRLPQTDPERQLAGWLEAFNRGEPAALKQFLQVNFPERANDIDQELEFRDQTGGFDLKNVEESSPTRIKAIMKERDGANYARLVLEIETADPHRIRSMNLRVIPRPAEFPPTPRLSEP